LGLICKSWRGPFLLSSEEAARREGASELTGRFTAGAAVTFPWLLFVATWLLMFGTQHRMDAPAVWLAGGGDIVEVAQRAHDGDVVRKVLIMALAAIGVVLLVRYRRRIRPGGAVAAVLVLYVCWAGLSVTWATDVALSFRRLTAYFLMLVFAAGLVARMDLPALGRFVMLMPVVNLIPGMVAEIRFDNFHPLTSGHRFGGTVHPNLAGASVSLGIVIFCWMLWRSDRPSRRKAACGLAVLLWFLLLSGSRTSAIALSVALGCSVLLIYVRAWKVPFLRPSGRIALAVGVLTVILLAVSCIALNPTLLNVMGTERDDGDISDLTGRTAVWQTCLSYAAEHPLAGVGFDGFWTDDHIETISHRLRWPINHAHSAYLDQLLALGVPGASLYLLLLLVALSACTRRFLRGDDRYGPWSALLVFVLVHNSTESINVLPTYPNFVVNLIVMRLALVPWTASTWRRAPHAVPLQGPGYEAICWAASA
jgi:O-antigen ligase